MKFKLKRLNLILDTFNQKCDKVLSQAQNTIEGKINISETDKQEIIEQIGEISGRDIKIYTFAKTLKKEAYKKAMEYRQKWHKELRDRISEKSKFGIQNTALFGVKIN